ncbi:3' exoribonuclease family, domain 1-domain-containing protein [Schizophyllum amplum]|uniref:3' exoribonuclease family, domain 1-domain-containing protein n=1 Tax=Schizophyllum amplum TaxID=97359 RepID=A0A550CCI1_9AGAR|nr:3' exoribonuclease family, domain 1-domain-containing protein [Auriculariopsis ampla]
MASGAFDRRRINGPEESFPPVFDDEDVPQPSTTRLGRSELDIRPIFLRPGLISQANGSAYIEAEKIKISCAVYGPRQNKNVAYSDQGRLNVEVKYAPYATARRKAPLRDAEDRSIGVAIHQALLSSVRLELLPKSTVDIFLVIIEADGKEACIVNGAVAASAALADAGIEMLGLVSCCSAAVTDDKLWLDPTGTESQEADGTVILACMPALDAVTSVWQSGRLAPQKALECMHACQQKCIDIHSVVAQALLEHTQTS